MNWKPTEAQVKLARRIESAGITTYSQVMKAMQRHDEQRMAQLKAALRKADEEAGHPWS